MGDQLRAAHGAAAEWRGRVVKSEAQLQQQGAELAAAQAASDTRHQVRAQMCSYFATATSCQGAFASAQAFQMAGCNTLGCPSAGLAIRGY